MIEFEGKPVYLACGHTDMRKSINGLSIIVESSFKLDPFESGIFVFCNRKRDRLKILDWDGDGFWLHFKRLEKGHFRWPAEGEESTMLLSAEELLHEPGKSAQSKSYMWLYRTSGDARYPIVLYEYQEDRKAKRPQEFLKDYKGFLHADGYSAYHKLGESITVVGCWAHLRRKFDEALKSLPPPAQKDSLALVGKRYCDKLFRLEKDFAELAPDERFKKRQKVSKPLIEAFFEWAKNCGALPKSPVGKAIYYANSQREYLENYLIDGRLEISNNCAERSIKPFVIGRKNFLFANTPRGARTSAILYSIIETAKDNGLEPFDYLLYILRQAPNLDIKDPEQLQTLLPRHFKNADRA